MIEQEPAVGVAKTFDDGELVGLKTLCQCGSDQHSVDTWIEIESCFGDISVTFNITQENVGIFARIKRAFSVLCGFDSHEHEIILSKQQAINWIRSVETTINTMEDIK